MDRLLTPGSLKKIVLEELPIGPAFKPVMQIVGLKLISKGSTSARYRVLLQDGINSSSNAMLAAEYSPMVENHSISANCLIRILAYSISLPSNAKKILCVNQMEVVKSGEEVGGKLGDPVPLKFDESATTAPAVVQGTALKDAGNTESAGSAFYGGKPQSAAGRNLSNQSKNPPKTSPGTPGGTSRIYPIASLTPYQNKWTIKCRVTQKSGVRTFNNSRGEGKFFNCVFTDDSGEIKATAWKNECDIFFDLLELNKVYLVSKAQLKTANKNFSSTNNDYEMNISADTKITACDESESTSVPSMQFSFITVEDLANQAVGTLVDLCGIAHTVNETSTIIAKASQREMIKRDIEFVDDSGMFVRLTLWGDEAKNFPQENGQVLAIKKAKVGDWNGRSLSLLSSSQLMRDPDCAEAHRLRGWYETHGHNTQFRGYAAEGFSGSGGTSQSNAWKTLDCIHTENIGKNEKPDYYMIKGMLAFIKKENCMYKACSSEACNKKVLDNGDGTYRCEKCNKTSPDFKHRLLLQVHLTDTMGYHWATAFQDTAEKLLGKTAEEIGQIVDDEDLFDATLKSALFKPYQMTLRTKMESYNDDARLKTVVVEAKDLDTVAYNKTLLEDIRKMMSTL